MKNIEYIPLPTQQVRALQRGEKDAHGNAPEIFISDGTGLPCRHCLDYISAGDKFLIVSYKPFTTHQPYAEQGPIFLHADSCNSYKNKGELPPMYSAHEQLILRGYNSNERIVYGTGKIVGIPHIKAEAVNIFLNLDVTYIHARSAANNCFQFRIDPVLV